MRSLVGLDLQGHDTGAIRFAAWAASTKSPPLEALHVLRRSDLTALLDHTPQHDIEQGATRLAQAEIDKHGARASWGLVSVVAGEAPELALGNHATRVDADVLVIGRRALTEGRALVRLGKVARRVLRRLVTTTVVVPPDFAVTSAGRGPIIVATDGGPASDGAANFARQLAERLDRTLVVAHTFEDLAAIAGAHLPAVELGPINERLEVVSGDKTRTWAHTNNLGECPIEVLRGESVGTLCRYAQSVDAAAIVCGSRRIGMADRLWQSSVGTGLASHAHCPVAVVPSDWGQSTDPA